MATLMWQSAHESPLPENHRAGQAIVATELRLAGRPALRCPAGVLVAGELAAAGVPTALRPVRAHSPEVGEAHEPVFYAELGGGIGLGVAAPARWRSAARRVLADWLAVTGERTVLLPAPRSFCAGVERAITAVEQALAQHGPPVYVRKQIVHNTHVVADLEERGAVFVNELDEVPGGATVVFSAHGVSPAVRHEADHRELAVIDATCPLVTKVHARARRLAGYGDTVILIGHPGHEEIEGIIGEAPEAITVVSNSADAAAVEVPDPTRVSYLTQTTLAVDETADILDTLRERFPRLRELPSSDICYATTNRQHALSAVATDADLVLVVGSANSSNSVRLAEVAGRRGTPSYLIDSAADIRASWLTGVRTIGLTAGASAPPSLIATITAALEGLGPVGVMERVTAHESIHFSLPPSVRPR
jgi:4-hydroxy-3-methylbut-2-enyl diphosphate reductase